MIKAFLPAFLAATLFAQQSSPHQKNIATIAKEAKGAVVLIVMSDKEGRPIAQGSGFLISKDGWVVTNYHVIKSGSSALIKLPDGAFFAVDGVLAFDKARDVAVLKAHGNAFPILALGNSDHLQVGEEVVAIGNPLSLESTVSNGIVSGIRTAEEQGGKFLQITAPISPGSSGGPLFNMAGEVVGITTSHLIGGQNLNFAIPVNDAKPMLVTGVSKPRALPDEPENEPEDAKTSVGQTNDPADDSKASLKETQQWIQDTLRGNSGTEITVSSGLGTEFGYLLALPDSDDWDKRPWYVDDGINANDGDEHNWMRETFHYEVSFSGCSMTTSAHRSFTETFKARASYKFMLLTLEALINAKLTTENWSSQSETIELKDYDPTSVQVKEHLSTETAMKTHYATVAADGHYVLSDDYMPDPINQKLPAGMRYWGDIAYVEMASNTGQAVLEIGERPWDYFFLEYPYALRFAKALRHAITLCGGKAPKAPPF